MAIRSSHNRSRRRIFRFLSAKAAQAVEHYEISRYGTLRTWAEELGLKKAVTLLESTLTEEKATDVVLTEIAESVVNQEAQAAAE
jgi:ferritin-like metal-binding protein YciE